MLHSMIRLVAFAFVILAVWLARTVAGADWLQWRGPQGVGVSPEKGLPTSWSPMENVKWRVELDGPGNSSPIVVGKRVLITHSPKDSSVRSLRCYDRNSGELLWKHEVEYADQEPTHSTNPYSAASPVSDGERIVAWYGSAGLFCYDLDGKVVWQKTDLGKVEHIWGYGSSPVIHENLVILNFGPGLNAFVAAFDKSNGKEVWRKTFPGQVAAKAEEFRGSWSTPVVAREGDQATLLLSLPNRLWAVDPATGDERWSCEGLGDLVYTSPLVEGDLIIAMSGYGGPALAVRAGGSGDVTATHRLWHHTRPNPPQRVGSGVLVDGNIYIMNEPGIAWCLDGKTGEKRWQQRATGAATWCSMAYVDGKLYISSKSGRTFVLEPNPERYSQIAENNLGEKTEASPAFSNHQIFLRTHKALYCIERNE